MMGVIRSTPGNNLLAEFAMKGSKRGTGRQHYRFLTVSFSSTDYVGHNGTKINGITRYTL
jgi:hypothetical protein